MQRARGRVEVAVARRHGATRLARLYQQGSGKARLPRVEGGVPEVVLLNTAGGIACGDRVEIALQAGAGAALVATTQAAERVYRALPAGAPARVSVALALGPGATLDWLPQETILFDGARLDREIGVDMAADARLTLVETLVLGRAAMGETVTDCRLAERWSIRREGRLVHAEALRIAGDVRAATQGPATLAGARALATLVHVGPPAMAEAALARARACLEPEAAPRGVAAAASLKAGVLVLRFLAAGHAPLRAALAGFLATFRDAPCPRVWSL